MGKRSREAVQATLAKHYSTVGITMIDEVSDLELLVASQPDLVFLGMEFIDTNPTLGVDDPDKIWISDYLEAHGIAHTGSGKAARELEVNKHLAKQCILDARLKTSPFFVIPQTSTEVITAPLSFPLFVKPTNRGGGLGIDSQSVVHTIDQLNIKIRSLITEVQSDALVERYLPGREFSVAILRQTHSEMFFVMPIELIAPLDEHDSRLLSRKVKTADAEMALPVTDNVLASALSELALDVFRALGAQDYGRIDIRLDEAGTPHFLEANLIPSLIENYGSFPKACIINKGLDYESMILQIVELGLKQTSEVSREMMLLRGEAR